MTKRLVTNDKLCAAARFAGHDAITKYRLAETTPSDDALLDEAVATAAKSLNLAGFTAAERLVFDAEWTRFWEVNGTLALHCAHARQMPRSVA